MHHYTELSEYILIPINSQKKNEKKICPSPISRKHSLKKRIYPLKHQC
jgi:hypothetical protein